MNKKFIIFGDASCCNCDVASELLWIVAFLLIKALRKGFEGGGDS